MEGKGRRGKEKGVRKGRDGIIGMEKETDRREKGKGRKEEGQEREGKCLLLKSCTEYNIKREIKIYIKKENYDSVQIHLLAASISPVSNKPLHKLGLSLKCNISLNTATLANSLEDTDDS